MNAQTPGASPLFGISQASFALDGRDLLKPVSLGLPARRVVGLIGQNGSGKSTLLKLLARQLAPTGGTLALDGRPLGDWGDRPFARRVGYLPQQTPATGGMQVRELVALGRYPWHGPFGRFSLRDSRQVEEAIALTGLAPLAERGVDTLSGGERQRAWLAMLVAQETDYLLLDEPIAALDIAHQLDVLALVRRLAGERGLGVLVVLHDVNMAARFCDEIVALRAGQIVARGTPDEVLTAAALREVYGVDMEVLRHPGLDRPIAHAR
ncbi:ATP-binding cassette domain-containing protein [Starkeya koreensis]|uniref:ATP-binding cassette domain-containing protein n=1 Tax=Ancylobacter koreensis TaxID=266121 RepID=A0ABT0DQS4_9HYPH|nr:ATP-binding cassette domain-containing protein [Ancylobacter koreensis]MCK0209462.1 ATP-binding cassette domain-containing protein [Ancylobacter koreensis]